LEQGKVASTVVLPFFAKRMEEAFGKNAEQNVNTLSGSANRMRNELTYMMDALDNGKVLSFWSTMQNGIANVFKDLTYYINQGSWKEFITHFGVNGGLSGNRIAKEAAVKKDLDRFNAQTPEKKTAEYQRLNSELAQAVKNSRDLIKAGIEPNTDFLTKAAAKLKLYRENLADANKAGATSMLDVSDGLAKDASRIAKASGVTVQIDKSALLGFEAVLELAALRLEVTTEDWVLFGGEDHALLATFPEGSSIPKEFKPIGRIIASSGVLVLLDDIELQANGWDSIRG
jgi:hypothetical protein